MPYDEDILRRRIGEMVNLPTIPGVLKRIGALTADKGANASDIATVISTDQVLSAKVLRLVNSPVYGFPGRISSITHAIVLLGFNTVKGLVFGTAVFDTLGKHGKDLWGHSLGTALMTRALAKEIGFPDYEEAMVAGLLHDLGKVALGYIMPDEYGQALSRAKETHCHIALAEREIIGVDHARVNRWLAEEWHFPEELSEPLAYHHRPELAKRAPKVTALVHVADIMARAMGYGHPGDLAMPELNHDAFQSLRLRFDHMDSLLESIEMEYTIGSDVLSA